MHQRGLKKHEKEKGMKAGRKQGERLGTIKTLCALANGGLLKADEAARRGGAVVKGLRHGDEKGGISIERNQEI